MKQPGKVLSRYPSLRRETEQMAQEVRLAPRTMKKVLRRKIRYNEQRLMAIRREIEGVKNPTGRMILIYRYLEGMTFEEIAQIMYISERHIYRLHKEALNGLKKGAEQREKTSLAGEA